jgi:DNA-directed RNA polymerase subunit RPC12/RpoP
MHLYCSCGYPIMVSARWDDEDDAIDIRLHDGNNKDMDQSVVVCPQCGQRLSLGALRPRPPHAADWLTPQDTGSIQISADTEDHRSENVG